MQKILIGLYDFDGPFSMDVEPLNLPGILTILRHASGDDVQVIQLVATENLNSAWRSIRARFAHWQQHELSMAIYYMPGFSQAEVNRVRKDIVDEFEMVMAA